MEVIRFARRKKYGETEIFSLPPFSTVGLREDLEFDATRLTYQLQLNMSAGF
jgi:hypothetical protein